METQSTSTQTSARVPIAARNDSTPHTNGGDHQIILPDHSIHLNLNSYQPKDVDARQPSKENCDRRRPDEEDASRLVSMPPQLVGKTVTPFLKEHIPGLYAPIGKPETQTPATMREEKDPNSRFCYRHRPDAKCRRAADESKMVKIQSVRRSHICFTSFDLECIGILLTHKGGIGTG
jgi:F-box and WD-40 domain protein MET30